MKTTEKIILKKEIELIIDYSINQDFTKIKDILIQQKDANILLYGFEFSHKHDVNFGTSYATSLREVDYSINLLELFSSNQRFHSVLAEMLNYPLVIQPSVKPSPSGLGYKRDN